MICERRCSLQMAYPHTSFKGSRTDYMRFFLSVLVQSSCTYPSSLFYLLSLVHIQVHVKCLERWLAYFFNSHLMPVGRTPVRKVCFSCHSCCCCFLLFLISSSSLLLPLARPLLGFLFFYLSVNQHGRAECVLFHLSLWSLGILD